jgi:hypothetical protein
VFAAHAAVAIGNCRSLQEISRKLLKNELRMVSGLCVRRRAEPSHFQRGRNVREHQQ